MQYGSRSSSSPVRRTALPRAPRPHCRLASAAAWLPLPVFLQRRRSAGGLARFGGPRTGSHSIQSRRRGAGPGGSMDSYPLTRPSAMPYGFQEALRPAARPFPVDAILGRSCGLRLDVVCSRLPAGRSHGQPLRLLRCRLVRATWRTRTLLHFSTLLPPLASIGQHQRICSTWKMAYLHGRRPPGSATSIRRNTVPISLFSSMGSTPFRFRTTRESSTASAAGKTIPPGV